MLLKMLTNLGDVACDAVEDVDEDEEDSDKDGHPAWHALGWHQKAEERNLSKQHFWHTMTQETKGTNVLLPRSPDPRDYDEHASREVVGDDVVRHLPLQDQLEPSDRVVS